MLLAIAFARPSVISAVAGQWVAISLLGLAMLLVGGLEVISIVQRRSKVLIGLLAMLALILAGGEQPLTQFIHLDQPGQWMWYEESRPLGGPSIGTQNHV